MASLAAPRRSRVRTGNCGAPRPAVLTGAVTLPPAATYTLQRLALFGGTVVFSAAVLRGVPFIVVLGIATIVSGILSYFLLAGSRARMAEAVAGKVSRLNERIEASAAAEDEVLDASEQAPPKPE